MARRTTLFNGVAVVCPMQDTILKLPTIEENMTVTDSRFDKLADRVNNIYDRLSTVEGAQAASAKPKSPATSWLPLAAATATIIVGVVTAAITVTGHIDGEFTAIRGDISALKLHEEKLDSAITVLTNQQNEQTQKLIRELLASAQSATKTDLAVQAVRAASTLTATLRQEKSPSRPEFFRGIVEGTRALSNSTQPSLRDAAFDLQTQLAEYRSALIPIKNDEAWTFQPMPHAITVYPNARISGGTFNMSNVSGDAIVAGKGIRTHPLPYLQGTVIEGGMQTLDGFEWQHVIFIGMHIRYKGGEVKLNGVVFINCTFDLQRDKRGARVADYVALDLPTLNIEGTPS
jgi:hypothetical protein